MLGDAAQRAAGLPLWSGPVEPTPVKGGITNANFMVEDGGARYFVRIGGDIPVHGIMRWSERAASRAAHAAGVSPEVVYAGPDALVLRFIEGRTLTPEDVRDPTTLERVVELVAAAHRGIPRHLRGPSMVFWVFHTLRDYAHTLRRDGSRMQPELPRLMAAAEQLEAAVGKIELVFGHNDLLAANLIDDGRRLWLIDWDYAGWNSPLFDLGGLASNTALSEDAEAAVIERYFGAPACAELRRRYEAMKCASLLREAMWSMVSELHSTLDHDFVAYTAENLGRFERAYTRFQGAP